MPRRSSKYKFTELEEAFITEMVTARSASEAYMRIRPGIRLNSARNNAHRLMIRDDIRKEVIRRRIISARQRAKQVDPEEELHQILRLDPADIVDLKTFKLRENIHPEFRRLITTLQTREVRRVVEINGRKEVVTETVLSKLVLPDKLLAIDKIIRIQGRYKDVSPIEQILTIIPRRFREDARRYIEETLQSGELTGGDPGQSTSPQIPAAAGTGAGGCGFDSRSLADSVSSGPVSAPHDPSLSTGGQNDGSDGSDIAPLFGPTECSGPDIQPDDPAIS